MHSVFRAQSAEARLVLVLCWLLLLIPAATSWIRLAQSDALLDLRRLFTAISLTFATLVFVRVQLAACRGGGALRQRWAPPLLIALALLPMLWGILSLVLCLAIAAAIVQYPTTRAVWAAGFTSIGFLVLYPRLDLEARVSAPAALAEMLIFAVIFVAVTRLAFLLDDLQFTREVLARRQVDLERERVGRDLHDLMGRTLVAASLRNQTALRTLGDGDPAAAARLEQLHETISRGQVQLRALTSGPAISGLDDELAAAQMLCTRMGIDLDLEVRQRPPSGQESLIGLVVRENITNILKHSRATSCRITIGVEDGETVVTVVNDGGTLNQRRATHSHVDSRLARAVTAAGGTTVMEPRLPSGFESVSRIPLPQRARS